MSHRITHFATVLLWAGFLACGLARGDDKQPLAGTWKLDAAATFAHLSGHSRVGRAELLGGEWGLSATFPLAGASAAVRLDADTRLAELLGAEWRAGGRVPLFSSSAGMKLGRAAIDITLDLQDNGKFSVIADIRNNRQVEIGRWKLVENSADATRIEWSFGRRESQPADLPRLPDGRIVVQFPGARHAVVLRRE